MKSLVTKKNSIALLIGLLIVFSILFLAPLHVHAASNGATTGGDIGAVNVSVVNGQLQIDGGGTGFGNANSASAWGTLFTKYRNFIVGISGIGAISMIVFFVVQFMKLGASAGNPSERTKALVGVLWTGLAAAGLGAVVIIVGFFYHSIG